MSHDWIQDGYNATIISLIRFLEGRNKINYHSDIGIGEGIVYIQSIVWVCVLEFWTLDFDEHFSYVIATYFHSFISYRYYNIVFVILSPASSLARKKDCNCLALIQIHINSFLLFFLFCVSHFLPLF